MRESDGAGCLRPVREDTRVLNSELDRLEHCRFKREHHGLRMTQLNACIRRPDRGDERSPYEERRHTWFGHVKPVDWEVVETTEQLVADPPHSAQQSLFV